MMPASQQRIGKKFLDAFLDFRAANVVGIIEIKAEV